MAVASRTEIKEGIIRIANQLDQLARRIRQRATELDSNERTINEITAEVVSDYLHLGATVGAEFWMMIRGVREDAK